VQNLKSEILHDKDQSPLLFIEVDPELSTNKRVLIYGHYDKLPPTDDWKTGYGPRIAIYRDDKLYGRGTVDNGYSIFSALTAIKICQTFHRPCPKVYILIDGEEASGSVNFAAYLAQLGPKIGTPDLIIGLTSGCLNYEQLWHTISARGLITGNLRIKTLTSQAHFGDAGGIVPDSFRILRQLLNRLDNPKTG